jgi:hypothetical protein
VKLPIPDAALDDRLFFTGTSGTGKTYNAMGRVERLLKRKNRVIIPDPLGVWWGLRLLADGKTASDYDVVIFGGPHGDLPLTEHAGALVGETVASMRESCILDLSELGTKAAERRFMLAFLTALYKHTPGEPVHMVFDEADMWSPQRLFDKEGEATKLLGIMETIVRRGRVKGFIPWLISQRPAVISKDVLSQVDGMVAFKLTSSQDRDAIGDWVQGQADKAQWRDLWAAMPTLDRGEGIVWIPGRAVLERVQFPEKETFDSSRTPKRGERPARAGKLKPIDVGAVKDRLAQVDAEAKANDPKKLRSEIAALQAEKARLEQATKAAPDKGTIAEAEKRGFERARKKFGPAADKAFSRAMASMLKNVLNEVDIAYRAAMKTAEMPSALVVDTPAPAPVVHALPAKAAPVRKIDARDAEGFTKPQTRVLEALAMWASLGHERPTREMVAAVAGYSPNSGGFNNLLGGLKTQGAIDYPVQGMVSLAVDGVGVITQGEGIALLLSRLSNPQKRIIGALVDKGDLSREDLAAATDYSANSGGFNNLLGSLRTLGLIDYPTKGFVTMSDWAQELLTGQRERIAA